MFDLAIKSFRGFHNQYFVPIRPITILVGQNSTGKTSLLSALYYLFDFASGENEASFNKPPFRLGTFKQIAHLRGGKAGRARNFQFCTRQNVNLTRRTAKRDRKAYQTEMRLTFSEVDGEPEINQFDIIHDKNHLHISLAQQGIRIKYSHQGGPFIDVAQPCEFPGIIQTDFSKNWRFLLRGIIYLTSRDQNQGELELIDADVLNGLHRMTHLAQQSGRHLAESVVATSPIRTEPQRTYTPTGATVDGEGSHVPFEIAKMYRSKNKSAWNQLKEKLESFGKESQMFRQIDVKSFGYTTDDPFQIQLSFDGPKMNLVDLGYGTSQVLPILFHVAQSKRRTRFLIQQPEVHLHAKAQASLGQFFVDSYIEKRSNFVIETHSDFIIDRFRLAVREGKINPEDISILFFQRKRLDDEIIHIELDKNGEPVDPPDSYRTFFIDEQMKILGIL